MGEEEEEREAGAEEVTLAVCDARGEFDGLVEEEVSRLAAGEADKEGTVEKEGGEEGESKAPRLIDGTILTVPRKGERVANPELEGVKDGLPDRVPCPSKNGVGEADH